MKWKLVLLHYSPDWALSKGAVLEGGAFIAMGLSYFVAYWAREWHELSRHRTSWGPAYTGAKHFHVCLTRDEAKYNEQCTMKFRAVFSMNLAAGDNCQICRQHGCRKVCSAHLHCEDIEEVWTFSFEKLTCKRWGMKPLKIIA